MEENKIDKLKMNEIIKTTDFSAKEPALGYYYQIRYSLCLLLKAREKDLDTEISIEKLDDIVIEDINSTNLLQTKLHIKSVANLTNCVLSGLARLLRIYLYRSLAC